MAENTNTERDRAIMEGERNASLEAYKRGAWPCTAPMERSYEAGFTNGWEHRASLSLPAAGQEPMAWTGGEEWEQLAWRLCAEENGEESCGELIWEGGPVPEPWGERWLKYEGEAKQMIELVRKFAAPQPAAQVAGQEPVAYVDERAIAWLANARAQTASITTTLGKTKSFERPMALCAAPQPAVAAGWPLIARALDEWHEDDGPVMWWAWNGSASGWAGEPAWCGTPLSNDWPGYHTHWTPHPTFPPAPSTEGERNG